MNPGDGISKLCQDPVNHPNRHLQIGYLDIWIMVNNLLLHPQSGLLCGAALPGAFFLRKTLLLRKTMIFDDFQMIFHQNGPNLLLTRGTTIKTGILTPIEFWWVP